jgi:O-antigen/teichoic acid export membrane protein
MAFGAIAGGVVTILKAVLQLLLLPVMARLLGPNEFGLYALALPMISLVTLLADGGLGNTLVREEETETLIWSSAYWALLFMGVSLAVGSSLFGIFLGYVAHQPRLPGLIALLSVSLIFLTLSVAPLARLTRRKNPGVGAGAELASAIIGAAVAVSFALRGAGAWSLAAQYVSTYVVRAVILNAAVLKFPTAEFSFEALRPHLVSGGILIASRISDYAGRATENFLLDRIFGTALLGSFNLANQVSRFATDAAANMSWGALFVQAVTEDRSRIIPLHRQLCRLLGLVMFPTTFLGAAAAPELVSLLLGPKWAEVVPLLRVFLLLYAFSSICSQTAPLLLAYGRFDIQFWCTLGLAVGRVLAVILGFWLGFDGTIYGMVVVTVLYCVAMLVVPAEVTGCRPIPMLRGLVTPLIASLAAVAVFFFLMDVFTVTIASTFASLFCGLAAYGLCLVLIDRRTLIEDWKSIRRVLRRG